MICGGAGGKVIQKCRSIPGPRRSARHTDSPGARHRDGAPFRPPLAVPPAPRAPAGFSNVTARESNVGSTHDGSHAFHMPASLWVAAAHRQAAHAPRGVTTPDRL